MLALFEFHFGLRSTSLLVFVLLILVFSIVFYLRGHKLAYQPDSWLSLLLFLFALYIMPWMFGHAGWYANDVYRDVLFFIPFHQYFFIGPVIWFLTRSLTEGKIHLVKKDIWHFIPGILYLSYNMVIAVCDLLIFEEYYFYADGFDKDLKTWYQVTGLSSIVVYLVFSVKKYTHYKRTIYDYLSFADNVTVSWLKNFLVTLILIITFRALFIIVYPEIGDWGFKYWYYLMLGSLCVYLSIMGFSNSIKNSIILSDNLILRGRNKESLNEHKIQSEDSNKEQLNSIFSEAKSLLIKDKLYQNPELTLPELSKALKTNTSLLSKAINTESQMNFNDFVNSFRIEEVKSRIKNGVLKELTLEAVAFDSGFNSKSTFQRAFKKHTGVTPTQFKARMV